jgi:hypothetical protein
MGVRAAAAEDAGEGGRRVTLEAEDRMRVTGVARTCRRVAAVGPGCLLFVLLAAAGCDRRGGTAPASTPDQESVVASPPPSEAAASAGADDPAPPAAHVALDSEGLRLVERERGSSRPLPFGSDWQAVESALTRLWGPPSSTAALPDCGADPPTQITWAHGFTAVMQGDRFVGWSAHSPRPAGVALPSRTITTMAGLGIGSRRGDVESAYAIDVGATSLGTEFTAGGIAGLFADGTADAPVTALWAGTVCIFR